MKHVKLFEQFISESRSNSLVDEILASLADDIQRLISEHEKAFQKHYERPMSDYDKELTRLNIIWDMVKAIEVYTEHTDSLISINSSISHKGNLEIFAQIQRGDQVYPFSTEVIYAGGHNIQRLHYRYITKSSIPKTGNMRVSVEYANKIKKLSKLEKLNQDIINFENLILRNQQKLSVNQVKSEPDIWEEIKSKPDYYEWPTWKEIVRRGADKNYNSEEDFNQKKEEDYKRRIGFWKKMNIDSIRTQILSHQKEVIKLRKKIEQTI